MMNEFDEEYWKETDQVLALPRRNPYRTGVKATIGYVVTQEEYQEYTAMKSRQAHKQKKSYAPENMAAAVIGVLAFIVMTVAALI